MINDGDISMKQESAYGTAISIGERESAVLHRHLHQPPLKVLSAYGNYLTLEGGRKVFDATGGAAVACIGHGNEAVKTAVQRQMEQVSYCHSLFFSSSGAENLAKSLVESTNGVMARAFIVSSGSEAMEAAMKLARQYFLELSPSQPERTRFIARKQSYHGTTLGSLAMGGHLARRKLFEPMLMGNISHVSMCNAYRGPEEGETLQQYVLRLQQELDEEFQRVGPSTVCAFVAEPVVGAALGCVPSVPGYFKAMKAICDKYGALLILDEVMCGMGRSGTIHAWQQEDVEPDIQTLGKGLGGGYAPIAAVLMNHRIISTLDKGSGNFSHGQTYQGHPVACAAAFEVQNIVKKGNLVSNVAKMGKLLEEGLNANLEDHPNVGNIRGKGLFWGIEFVKDRKTKEAFPPEMGVAMLVHSKGIEEPYNISIYPGTGSVDGWSGDHVLLAPAYNVTKEEIDFIVTQTGKVIHAFFEELPYNA